MIQFMSKYSRKRWELNVFKKLIFVKLQFKSDINKKIKSNG
jgi:hypothetical protein